MVTINEEMGGANPRTMHSRPDRVTADTEMDQLAYDAQWGGPDMANEEIDRASLRTAHSGPDMVMINEEMGGANT
ncbi:hypothetical protein DIPPA_02624 [Diplonema papillatum]|nr:hypothetical protein DIPPA_02624 [Diplonema papillatum]